MRNHTTVRWWVQRCLQLEELVEALRDEVDILQHQKNSFDQGREQRIKEAVLERNAALAQVARLEAKLERVKDELGRMGLLDLEDAE